MKNICKYTIILDLDQTLVDADVFDKDVLDKDLINFDPYILFQYPDHKKQKQIAVPRPGLQHFLDFLFEHFNVGVWTAATKSHGKPIIENFITGPDPKNRKLQFIIYREHVYKWYEQNRDDTRLASMRKHLTKDLDWLCTNKSQFNLSMCSTILIDDARKHVKIPTNRNNIIHIDGFYFNKPRFAHDSELFVAIQSLKDLLKSNEKIIDTCSVSHSSNNDLCTSDDRLYVYLQKHNDNIHDYFKTQRETHSVTRLKDTLNNKYQKTFQSIMKSSEMEAIWSKYLQKRKLNIAKLVKHSFKLFKEQNIYVTPSVFNLLVSCLSSIRNNPERKDKFLQYFLSDQNQDNKMYPMMFLQRWIIDFI